MTRQLRTIAIIPARGGSKRLPRKNIFPLLGKPLLAWVIEAALQTEAIGRGNVFVSTEDEEIAEVTERYGATVVWRPRDLAEDEIWTEPVIRHAVLAAENGSSGVDLVAWLNASIPEIRAQDIDAAIRRLLRDELREIFAVDAAWNCTSAVRILRREALFQKALSVNCGVIPLDYVDIHTEADVARVLERMREIEWKREA